MARLCDRIGRQKIPFFPLISLLLVSIPGLVWAGGPKEISPDYQPYLWQQLPIEYRIDSGHLDSIPETKAIELIEKAFQTWADVETASLSFRGRSERNQDIEPASFYESLERSDVDCEIILDDGGQVIQALLGQQARESIYGLTGLYRFDDQVAAFQNSWMIFNGATLNEGALERVALHEIGHLIGLDHTQVGRRWAENATPSDNGLIPVMYPFILPGGPDQPRLDDIAWASWLYPKKGFDSHGALKGRVFRASGEPLSGVHVVAVRAEVENPQPHAEQVSAISGRLSDDEGEFFIPGLPPGDYHLFFEPLEPGLAGVSAAAWERDTSLEFEPDFYNGRMESGYTTDLPSARVPIKVSPGETTGELFLLTNEFSGVPHFPAGLNPQSPLGAFFIGVALFNPNPTALPVLLKGYGKEGRQEVAQWLDTLEPRQQKTLLVNHLPEVWQNSRSLATEGDGGPLLGFFMVGDKDLSRIDGVGGELRESRRLILAPIHVFGGKDTVLFLDNPSEEPVDVNATLHDLTGTALRSTEMVLAPSSLVYWTSAQIFGPGLILDRGYLELNAARPIRAYQMTVQERNISALRAQAPSPVKRLLAPHFFADSKGGRTELRLLNSGFETAPLVVRAWSDDGVLLGQKEIQLAPGQLFVWDLLSLLDLQMAGSQEYAALTGYLEVAVATGPGIPLIGSVHFQDGRGEMSSSLPMLSRGAIKTRYLHVAQSREAGMYTGISILNPSSVQTQADLRVYDEAGNLTGTRNLQLAPGERLSGLLSDERLLGPSFIQVGGHIEIRGDSALMTFALFGDYQSRFLSAIEGQPSLTSCELRANGSDECQAPGGE